MQVDDQNQVSRDTKRNEFLKEDGEVDMEFINNRIQQLAEAQRVLEDRDPHQELATALMLDRAEEIQNIISKHPQAFPGWDQLFSIALSGKPNLLRLALENGADVNTPGRDGLPALVSSCRSRATTVPEIYTLLLQHSVDLYADDGFFSPLQKAISNQDLDLIQALVDAGIDLNRHDSERGPCLFFALHMNSFDAFYRLVHCGADIHSTHRGFSLLHYLCLHSEISCGAELTEFLVSQGLDVEVKDQRGYTPFQLSIAMGRIDLLKTLKRLQCNVHVLDSFGGNGLWILVNSAVGIHRIESISFLVQECGLDVHGKVGSETFVSRLSKYMQCVRDNSVYSLMWDECVRLGLVSSVSLPSESLEEDVRDPLDQDL